MQQASIQIQIREPHVPQTKPTSPLTNDLAPSKEELPVLDFIASDETLDRYGEILCASGWRLETYRRNPVFQNAHQYGDILFTLGKALVTEVIAAPSEHSAGGAAPVLYQRVQFATDVNPMARIAYGLYKGRFLNAVSVGFVPLRWQDPNGVEHTSRSSSVTSGPLAAARSSGQTGARQPRRRYLEQELLEVSAVGIPANPNALALGLKTGAVEKTDLRETLELLLMPGRAKERQTNGPSHRHHELFQIARELHRILRHA